MAEQEMQGVFVIQVTGDRRFGGARVEREQIWDRLDRLASERDPENAGSWMLISGMAKGVDSAAAAWAKERGVALVEVPADWSPRDGAVNRRRADGTLYFPGAGPERNQRMVDMCLELVAAGASVHVVAWLKPGSRGTADMVRRCKAAGLHGTIVKVGR